MKKKEKEKEKETEKERKRKEKEKGKGKRIGRKVTRRNGGERVNKMGRKWMKNGERRKRKKKKEEEEKKRTFWGQFHRFFFSIGLHQQVLVGGASSISLRDFTIFFWTALAFATVLDASARAVRDNEADRRLQP